MYSANGLTGDRRGQWRREDPSLGRWGYVTYGGGDVTRTNEFCVARYHALYGEQLQFVPDQLDIDTLTTH